MAEKSKKKILYIITKSVWGGAGKYVYDLAMNLPKDKFDVFVAAGGKGELAKKLIASGIPYFEIKNFQRDVSIFKEIFAYFEILLLLLKIRPDIIHTNSSKAGGIAGVAALDYRFLTLNFKVKTFFTAHGWAYHENRPFWQIILIKLFSIVMSFYYSKIICVSEYDRRSAMKNRIAPAKKLITIHNGIDSEKYKFLSRKEARMKLNIPPDALCIGTIGEFTNNKGQEYLIEAVQRLKAKSYNLKAVIIGWGEEEKNLKSPRPRQAKRGRQISNLKLENEVFLINNLPEAAPYLKAFDIFVLPSIKEGLPYTLLEAGLAELPVIATNVGGIPEIIEDEKEGLLAEPADSGDLARKIGELIKNPEKGKIMARSLRKKVLEEFSLEKMLNATISTYS